MNRSLDIYEKKKKYGIYQDGIITLELLAQKTHILQGP